MSKQARIVRLSLAGGAAGLMMATNSTRGSMMANNGKAQKLEAVRRARKTEFNGGRHELEETPAYRYEIVGDWAHIYHFNGSGYVKHPRRQAIFVGRNRSPEMIASIENTAKQDSEHFQRARGFGFPDGWARVVHDVLFKVLNHRAGTFEFVNVRIPADTVLLALGEGAINWWKWLAIDDAAIEAYPVRVDQYDVDSIHLD